MAAKKPGKPQPTVTLKHLAAELAEGHEIAKKQAETILNDLVGSIVKHLKKGNRLLEKASMVLQRPPKPPQPVLFIKLAAPRVPVTWAPYLGQLGAATA